MGYPRAIRGIGKLRAWAASAKDFRTIADAAPPGKGSSSALTDVDMKVSLLGADTPEHAAKDLGLVLVRMLQNQSAIRYLEENPPKIDRGQDLSPLGPHVSSFLTDKDFLLARLILLEDWALGSKDVQTNAALQVRLLKPAVDSARVQKKLDSVLGPSGGGWNPPGRRP